MVSTNEGFGKIEALDGLRGLAYREMASAEVVTVALGKTTVASESIEPLQHQPNFYVDPVEN